MELLNMDRIINCTPHVINVLTEEGIIDFPTSGIVPRVSVTRTQVGTINNIPVYGTVLGEIENLHEPVEGIIRIVSMMIAEHPSVKYRDDLIYPGELVRDESGKPIGCKGFTVRS